tara:strand:- start:339 stop:479 length:141 start_codon:yes stop_codon:yes gene_type:complete
MPVKKLSLVSEVSSSAKLEKHEINKNTIVFNKILFIVETYNLKGKK